MKNNYNFQSDLYYNRKVTLSYCIKSASHNGCTQFYIRKIGAEQINGKPKRKVKDCTNAKAFRFVHKNNKNLMTSKLVVTIGSYIRII